MEESNLNSNNSQEVDKIKENIEVWEENTSNFSSQDVSLLSNETSLNIDNDDISESVEKPKFSFLSLFSKKNKIDWEDLDNAWESYKNDSQENIIVWSNNNSTQNTNVNIFQELWDLNFLETQTEINYEIKNEPIILITKATTYIFYIILVFNILFFLHIYIKSTDSDFVSYIPWACTYIGSNIDWYDNSVNCKTFPKIVSDITTKKDNLEKTILDNLKKLIPNKLQIEYVLATPEVKFILDKKSKSNVLYTKILSEFELIRTNATWWYRWKNIICSNYSFDDKWILTLTCDFLWAPILDEWQSWDATSRTVAIDFLKQLQLKNSNFQVMNYPKSIEISQFNSADWLLTIFKTKSTLTLNLKYNLSSK